MTAVVAANVLALPDDQLVLTLFATFASRYVIKCELQPLLGQTQ